MEDEKDRTELKAEMMKMAERRIEELLDWSENGEAQSKPNRRAGVEMATKSE